MVVVVVCCCYIGNPDRVERVMRQAVMDRERERQREEDVRRSREYVSRVRSPPREKYEEHGQVYIYIYIYILKKNTIKKKYIQKTYFSDNPG